MKPQDTQAALSHDWLTGMRGGEKCLESIIRVFPKSEIYTLFRKPGALCPAIESRPIHTSWLQRIPGVLKLYKLFLPFFPGAVETFRPSGDVVISTSHCVAKGIRPERGTPHVCYCFTPMRYAWLFFDEYFGRYPAPVKAVIRRLLASLRDWDRRTSSRVTEFIAISHHVRKRIKEFYGREASVIYPPADTEFYSPAAETRGNFYLIVSALVPYKRVDLAIEAFNRMGKKLVVIGSGPERERLQKLAGPTIEFLGWQSDEKIRSYYRSCRALIFPGEEDFGIVPVEAQACGAPVIALAVGGALETVTPKTGVFFEKPDMAPLIRAVGEMEAAVWDAGEIRRNAERFGRERFEREIRDAVMKAVESRSASGVAA